MWDKFKVSTPDEISDIEEVQWEVIEDFFRILPTESANDENYHEEQRQKTA